MNVKLEGTMNSSDQDSLYVETQRHGAEIVFRAVERDGETANVTVYTDELLDALKRLGVIDR